jgi:hypothetical protein
MRTGAERGTIVGTKPITGIASTSKVLRANLLIGSVISMTFRRGFQSEGRAMILWVTSLMAGSRFG